MPTVKKNKKPKKRASKYEDKLAVNLSFEELIAVSLAKPPTKGKK